MKNNQLKIFSIGLWLVPLFAAAEPASNLNDISKDVWLGQIKTTAAVSICKGFIEEPSIAMQMKAHDIGYNNCVTLITPIADDCEKKYEASLPATINNESAEKWGRLIGECIGNNFASRYLYPHPKPAAKSGA